jgi:hypothetical protein
MKRNLWLFPGAQRVGGSSYFYCNVHYCNIKTLKELTSLWWVVIPFHCKEVSL